MGEGGGTIWGGEGVQLRLQEYTQATMGNPGDARPAGLNMQIICKPYDENVCFNMQTVWNNMQEISCQNNMRHTCRKYVKRKMP